jgi:hypothetical protein
MSKLTREQIKEEVRGGRIIHVSWRDKGFAQISGFSGEQARLH